MKVTKRLIVKDMKSGLNQSQIARKYGVTPPAINKHLKQMVDSESVSLFDNKLDQVLKTSAMKFISDSLLPAKLQKSSTLQSMTAGGICLTHLQGLPKTQINIQIVNQRIQSAADERAKIEHEIAELSGDDQPLPLSSLNVIDNCLEPLSCGCKADVINDNAINSSDIINVDIK